MLKKKKEVEELEEIMHRDGQSAGRVGDRGMEVTAEK